MVRRQSSREFKLEAVQLVKERRVSVVQASRDLEVGDGVLRRWIKELGADPGQAFLGQDQLRQEQQELDRLRREVAKLKAQGDIQKSRGLLCEGVAVKFGFVAKHRGISPVRWLCEAFDVSAKASTPGSPGRPVVGHARTCSDEDLGAQVKASFIGSDRTYSPHQIWSRGDRLSMVNGPAVRMRDVSSRGLSYKNSVSARRAIPASTRRCQRRLKSDPFLECAPGGGQN